MDFAACHDGPLADLYNRLGLDEQHLLIEKIRASKVVNNYNAMANNNMEATAEISKSCLISD